MLGEVGGREFGSAWGEVACMLVPAGPFLLSSVGPYPSGVI